MSSPKTSKSAKSSAEFSAELTPDTVVQRLSAGLSVLCWFAGVALIAVTAIPRPLQVLAVTAWLGYFVLRSRQFPLRRLRVYANGDVHLQHVDGRWFDGRIAPGSLFLPRVAWLRVEGRRPYCGWFVADDDAPAEWRRLRVMARHFADI